jgi:hypothetical protein
MVLSTSFFNEEQQQLLYGRLQDFAELRNKGRRGKRNHDLHKFLHQLEREMLARHGNSPKLRTMTDKTVLRHVNTLPVHETCIY